MAHGQNGFISVQRSAQAQPPKEGVACTDDVRIFIRDQPRGAAAVACSNIPRKAVEGFSIGLGAAA
jgi:hypothetical protein